MAQQQQHAHRGNQWLFILKAAATLEGATAWVVPCITALQPLPTNLFWVVGWVKHRPGSVRVGREACQAAAAAAARTLHTLVAEGLPASVKATASVKGQQGELPQLQILTAVILQRLHSSSRFVGDSCRLHVRPRAPAVCELPGAISTAVRSCCSTCSRLIGPASAAGKAPS